MLARVLGFLYGALAVAPYVVLVQLGEVLLAADRSGALPDRGEVMTLLMWLTGAFGLRYGIYFVALTVTHFADVRFGHIVRSRMVGVLSAAPLAWFTSTNSGAVRKAIQDDTHDVHTVIAHAPVESAAAVSAPVSLLIYAFVVDWRLGLLSIATLPLYGLLNAWMMRGMGEKTAEMDRHLTRVSSTMVEFVSGISVVKAFGTVGRSHERFTRAAEDFSRFYVDWCGPLLKGSALGQATVSPSLILLVSTAGGSALAASGIVSPVQVITCALIALVIPAAIEVLGTTTWAYQIAGAAALRIVDLLSVAPLPAEGSSVLKGADINIDGVSFSYGSTLALDDVSLTIPQGSVTALVGSSGSGKSTLATLVARFADPDRGLSASAGSMRVTSLRTSSAGTFPSSSRTRSFSISPCVTTSRWGFRTPAMKRCGLPLGPLASTITCVPYPEASTASSGRTPTPRVVRRNASQSLEPSSSMRPSSSSTRPPPSPTRKPKPIFRRRSPASSRERQSWSSRTARHPSSALTRSPSSTLVVSSRWARPTSSPIIPTCVA